MKKIAKIWKEKFIIAKSKKVQENAFANIIDKNEITVIIQKENFNKRDIIKIEKDYRLITFEMVLPFNLVGFIAKIANALAEEKIPIFVVSAYSTDHLLVKEKYLKKTIKQLEKLGFEIK